MTTDPQSIADSGTDTDTGQAKRRFRMPIFVTGLWWLLAIPLASNWSALLTSVLTSDQETLAQAGDSPWTPLCFGVIGMASMHFAGSRRRILIVAGLILLGVAFTAWTRFVAAGVSTPWVVSLAAILLLAVVSAALVWRTSPAR